MPAGIVPTTSSQPSFASASSAPIPRSRRLRPSPLTIRTQSRQKKTSRTIAVARWVATRKVMKYWSFWWMSQPSSWGRITLCPRLEIGNSSVTPWSRPRTIAWPYVISDARRSSGAARRRRSLAGLEPGEDEQREADEERGDAVLDVVVARAGLVAREEPRQRARRLDPVDVRTVVAVASKVLNEPSILLGQAANRPVAAR